MYQFKNNKYTKWYYQIIHNAKNKTYENQYTENHHIIPRSFGGNNTPSNLIVLSGREHFIVHLLLIKMVDDSDVYKMVHAIVRFTSKVKNSKEYELLRKYVSTYSKGKYNKSFGKIWAYDEKTLEIFFVDKSNFDQFTLKKGLPFQRGGHQNYIWINNGKKESMIPKTQEIPFEWEKGRNKNSDLEHMKYMAAQRHQKKKIWSIAKK